MSYSDDTEGNTSGSYGFDGSDSFSLGSENVSKTGPSGGDRGGNENFFGGSDFNVMDFGRGSVSNVTNSPNYDANFAGLGMIGRGLNPGFQTVNQMNFDVPDYLQPQLEGQFGKFGPKYYSPIERSLATMEPVGLMAMAGKAFTGLMKDSFTDAKNALGKMGDAAGGLSLSDLVSGVFSSETGQNAVDNMADNVSFDAAGNRIELGNLTQAGANIPVTDPLSRVATNPIFNTSQVNRQQLDSMNRDGTGFATAAGSLFPRTTENSPNFSTPSEENLGMTIDRMSPNRYSLNARDPGFQIEMNRLKPAERAFLTGRTDTISPTDSTYDDDFQKTAEANINAGTVLQGIGSKFRPQINQFLKQNVNPNLNFESGFRRDTDDPDKMMPYMGVNIPFNIG